MNDNEPIPQDSSPAQGAMAIAAIACFVSLLLFYSIARPLVERLEVRWAEFLVYAILPLAVTFIILYRSRWHRELTGAARTCSLLLLSGFILSCEVIGFGFIVGLALFCLNGISGGNH